MTILSLPADKQHDDLACDETRVPSKGGSFRFHKRISARHKMRPFLIWLLIVGTIAGCHRGSPEEPASDTFAPPPKPYVDMTITELWERLATFMSARVPGFATSVNPPATDAEIEELETLLDLQLPAELVELLKCLNGQPDGCPLVPAEYSRKLGRPRYKSYKHHD